MGAACSRDEHGARIGELVDLEDAIESLAGVMLDVSVEMRKGNVGAAVEKAFAKSIVGTGLPRRAGDPVPDIKWLARHDWEMGAERTLGRAEFEAGTHAFFDHFSEVEDLRIKVPQAEAAGEGRLAGKFSLALVGRDREGRREWVRGTAAFEARRVGESSWHVEVFRVEKLESLLATRDVFSEVADRAGMSFPNTVSARDDLGGEGAAAADADGDGLVDLYVVNPLGGRLYLNRGDGTFQVSPVSPLLKLPTGVVLTAPLFLDYDNDGDSDLFVAGSRRAPFLFENRLVPSGLLFFRDVSEKSGLVGSPNAYSVVAGDVNRDGYPDLYVTSYGLLRDPSAPALSMAVESFTQGMNGKPNLLYVNQRNGTFREEAERWGVADTRWSLAAGLVDLDDDGDQDLVLANDWGGGSTLYLNEGERFRDAGRERGLFDERNGMGVSVADYDNDGLLDVHITNMSSMAATRIFKHLKGDALPGLGRARAMAVGNSVYRNVGGGKFAPSPVGAIPAGWAWGGGFVDLDNDGWMDIHSPNGFVSGALMNDT